MKKHLDDYIGCKQKEKLREDTLLIYKKIITKFINFVEKNGYNFSSLNGEKAQEYVTLLESEGNKSSSINQHLAAIKGFIDYLIEKRKIDSNPFLYVKHQPNRSQSKTISDVEIAKAIRYLEEESQMDIRDRLILLLIIKYGARGADICKLTMKDVVESGKNTTINYSGNKIEIDSPLINRLFHDYLNARLKSVHKEFFLTQFDKPLKRPHIVYITKRFTTLIGLSQSSLVLFSKRKFGQKNSNLIHNRFEKIKNVIKLDDYQVFRVIDTLNNDQKRLLKVYKINKDDKIRLKEVKKELSILTGLNSENIFNLNEIIEVEDKKGEMTIYVVTNDFDGHYLPFYIGQVKMDEFVEIALHLLSAITYLHSNNILAACIRPETIFIKKENDRWGVKIIDLIYAVRMNESNNYQIMSNVFIAPEVIKTKEVDRLSDLYAVGIALFYLAYGKLPYSKGYREQQISFRNKYIKEELLDILRKMVSIDPACRFATILACEKEFLKFKNPKTHQQDSRNFDIKNFSIKISDDISKIKDGFSALLKGSDFPLLIKIEGEKGLGQFSIISDISSLSAINSVSLYKINLEIDYSIKLFADLFIEKVIGKEDPNFPQLSDETDYKNQKISLFEYSLNKIKTQIPLVLIIENFHLASSDFVDFFMHVIRNQKNKREQMIIFVTCVVTHEISKLFSSIDNILKNKSDQLSIKLESFNKEKVVELLVEAFKAKVSDEVIDYVYKESDGKAGKLTDIVNSLLEKEYFELEPQTKRVVFKRKFYELKKATSYEELDSATKWIISVSACYKKPVEQKLLIALVKYLIKEISDKELINAINSLINKKILKITKLGSNDGMRNYVALSSDYSAEEYYQNISRADKLTIHNLIASHLDNLRTPKNEQLIDEIGNHYFLGENREKSTIYIKNNAQKSKELGLLKEAFQIFCKLDIFYNDYTSNDKLEILFEKINLLIELYELDKAREEIEVARPIAKEEEDTAQLRIFLSRILLKEGKIKEGLVVIDDVLTAYNSFSKNKTYLSLVRYKASSLLSLSRFSDAIDFLNKEIVKIISNTTIRNQFNEISSLKNSLGLAHFYRGECSVAINILQDVITLSNESIDTKILLTTYHNLGIINYNISNFKEALVFFEKALIIAEESFDVARKGIILLNIAGINHRLGNFKNSLAQYEQVDNLFGSIGKIRNYENLLLGFCLLKTNLGLIDEARTILKKAEELAIERSNNLVLAHTYALRGEIERAESKWHLALDYYDKSIELFNKNNLLKELAQINIYKSEVLLITGKINLGLNIIENVKKIIGIDQFGDIIIRLTIQEILLKLNNDVPIHYADINTLLNNLKTNKILDEDWETNFNFLRVLAIFKQISGSIDESKEVILKIKNQMNRAVNGLDNSIVNSFFKKSEFGKYLMEIEGKKEKSDIERVLEINLEITENLNLTSVLNKILNNLLILSVADLACLFLKNHTGEFNITSALDRDGNSITKFEQIFYNKIVDRIIKSRELVFISDTTTSPEFRDLKGKIKSILAIPLSIRNELLGLLLIESKKEKIEINKKDLKLYSLFGSQAAIAIENAKNYSRLLEKHDSLLNETNSIKTELELSSTKLSIHEKRVSQSYSNIIGISEPMKHILDTLLKVSKSDNSILILGESGTGKELIARAIHQNSVRKDKPFLAENCAAFTETLFESELFGHKKGAFTNADTLKRGIFEVADKGTVFLDEIGEMAPRMQTKLLRFLETGELRRVGDESHINVDVRIISATNKNLLKMVDDKTFRLDLYSRINVISIKLPPLRERKDDISFLIRYFLDRYNSGKNQNIFIDDDVIEAMKRYNWPGNVRELENEIQRLLVMRESDRIDFSLIDGDQRFK